MNPWGEFLLTLAKCYISCNLFPQVWNVLVGHKSWKLCVQRGVSGDSHGFQGFSAVTQYVWCLVYASPWSAGAFKHSTVTPIRWIMSEPDKVSIAHHWLSFFRSHLLDHFCHACSVFGCYLYLCVISKTCARCIFQVLETPHGEHFWAFPALPHNYIH